MVPLLVADTLAAVASTAAKLTLTVVRMFHAISCLPQVDMLQHAGLFQGAPEGSVPEDPPGRGFLVVWDTEKANLLPPPLSSKRLIKVPLPTPDGPHTTSALGLALVC